MGEEEKFGLKAYTSEQDENQMIAPSVPWGILVPAVRQYVKLIEPENGVRILNLEIWK